MKSDFSRKQNSKDSWYLLTRNSSWLYFTKIFNSGLNFLILIITIKMLSVEEYAVYAYLLAAISLGGLLTYFGIPNSYQRFVPEMLLSGDREQASYLYISGLLVRVFGLVIIYSVALCFFILLEDSTPLSGNLYLLLFCTPLAFSIPLLANNDAGLGALLLQKQSGILRILISIMQLLSLLWLGVNQKLSIESILLIMGLLYLMQLSLGSILIFKYLGTIGRRSGLGLYRNRIIEYSKYNYFTQVQYAFMDSSIGILIAGYFLSSESLAYVAFALSFSGSIFSIIPLASLQEVIIPVLLRTESSINKSAFNEKVRKAVETFSHMLALVYFPMFFVITIFASIIITLVGKPEYLNAVKLLILAAAFRAVAVWSTPSKVGLVLLEKPRELFQSMLVFVAYIPLSLILIPLLGDVGAIVAWGVVFVILAVIRGKMLQRFCKVQFINKETIFLILVGATMSAGLTFIRNEAIVNGLSWFITTVASFFLYGFFILNFCLSSDIQYSFRMAINSVRKG